MGKYRQLGWMASNQWSIIMSKIKWDYILQKFRLNDAFTAYLKPPLNGVDFTIAQQNTVYTVPPGTKFKPDVGEILTDTITGIATPPTYKWLANSTDLMSASLATMNAVNEFETDNLNAQQYWPAGTVIKMEVTIAGTSTTHTGKAILKGVLVNVT